MTHELDNIKAQIQEQIESTPSEDVNALYKSFLVLSDPEAVRKMQEEGATLDGLVEELDART